MINSQLTNNDLHFVLTRIPRDVLSLIKKEKLIIGGGFIRETISGNTPKDIDLFGNDANVLRLLSEAFGKERDARIHKTDNAITIIKPPRMPVQFITRWVFDDPVDIASSFDFTVCQCVIWFDNENKKYKSAISNKFYSDLAARRLSYTSPSRKEDAGGSILRVRKFLQRGYSIQANSLAAVISRLVSNVRFDDLPIEGGTVSTENALTKVISGLLHEVDPLLVIDGIEPREEHDQSLLLDGEENANT